MDKRLLDILCCPRTRIGLRQANRDEIEVANQAIARGSVASAAGIRLSGPLASALITMDGKTLYPVIDDIPVLLVDEGIETAQFTDPPSGRTGATA